MDKQPQSRAPLIVAIVLLLLPVYVAIYLALVIPGGEIIVPRSVQLPFPHAGVTRKYKLGGTVSEFIFWPLEQIDRQVRPGKWVSEFDQQILPSAQYLGMLPHFVSSR